MSALKTALARIADAVNADLARLIPEGEGLETPVYQAMRYAALDGGKRLRPFLAVQSAALFGVTGEPAMRPALAVELVHCYSLVHDDLPAMDDDDLRRGKPTCHKQFDEATAILAGDALLTFAFEVLADPATHPDAAIRAELVLALSRASGMGGMVGGQMADIAAETRALQADELTRLQQMKTGRLFDFACSVGPIMGHGTHAAHVAMKAYAHDLGLAFQIADDLLDVEGTAEDMGKAVGKDAQAGKATFVSLLGVDRARQQAELLTAQAVEHLAPFGPEADLLRDLARFVTSRRT